MTEITCYTCGKTVLKRTAEITRRFKKGAKYFFCSRSCTVAHSNKVSPRKNPSNRGVSKYTWNENIVKTDLEFKYYLLGFCCADSSITIKNNGAVTGVILVSCDLEVLYKVQKRCELSFEPHKVRETQEGHKDAFYILFPSFMAREINSWGLIGLKKTRPLPDIPFDYFSHFLRGYFDGDGTISVRRDRNKFSISIVCHPLFGNQIQEKITETLNLPSSLRDCHKEGEQPLKDITYYADNAKIFCDFIYKDATIYMERKHEIYNKLKEY